MTHRDFEMTEEERALEKKIRREETRAASYDQEQFVYRAPRRHNDERW